MVEAKVTKEFKGVRDGEMQARVISLGVIISGDLARVAIQEGWAERLETGKPDRTKAGKVEASGAASRPVRASRKSKSKKSKTQE